MISLRLLSAGCFVEVKAMLAAELTTKPLCLQPHVVTTVIDDGAVLFDLETKYFYRLNASGWAMVKMFEDGATVEQVRSQCRAWNAPDAHASALERVIETLVWEKLVSTTPRAAARPELRGPWIEPVIERQAEPLPRLISSAVAPSIPLVECVEEFFCGPLQVSVRAGDAALRDKVAEALSLYNFRWTPPYRRLDLHVA